MLSANRYVRTTRGNARLASALAAFDCHAFLERVLLAPDTILAGHDGDTPNPCKLSAVEAGTGATEVYLDGREAGPIREWLRCEGYDFAPLDEVVAAFSDALTAEASRQGVVKLGVGATPRSISLLFGGSGGVPHIDTSPYEIQGFGAASPNLEPTLVLRPDVGTPPFDVLLWPRNELMSALVDATYAPLQPGDVTFAGGEVVHTGRWRMPGAVVIFGVVSDQYERTKQSLPWVVAEHVDLKTFCRVVLDWRSAEPWRNYAVRLAGEEGLNFREEVEKMAKKYASRVEEFFD